MRKTTVRDVLTSRELLVILITVILATDSFTSPRGIARLAGRDGWLSMMLAGLWSLLVAVTVIKLAGAFPRRSPNAWIPQLFGRWGGKLFIVFYILFLLMSCAWTLRLFCDVMNIYLLPRTPPEVIIFALLVCVLYLTSYGINPMARVTGIFFLVAVVPGLLLLATFKGKVDFGELLPVLAGGVVPVVQGMIPALAAYHGWSVALYLAQFMDLPKEASRAAALAVVVLMLFFTWVYVLTIAKFGPLETQYLLYPVVELVREMEGIKGFIEKLDLLFLISFIIGAFVSVTFTYYVAVLAASQLWGLQDRRPLLLCLLPLIYFLALLPTCYKAAERMGEWIYYGGVVLDVGLLALALRAWWKMRRGGLGTHEE
ncbi:MAG TPA: endospore germination permease [Clostridia bacterium]|nr:endospore germination permease [Clostridia bacterium]